MNYTRYQDAKHIPKICLVIQIFWGAFTIDFWLHPSPTESEYPEGNSCIYIFVKQVINLVKEDLLSIYSVPGSVLYVKK